MSNLFSFNSTQMIFYLNLPIYSYYFIDRIYLVLKKKQKKMSKEKPEIPPKPVIHIVGGLNDSNKATEEIQKIVDSVIYFQKITNIGYGA